MAIGVDQSTQRPEEKLPIDPQTRLEETMKAHRRNVWLQIYLPVILGFVGLIAILVIVALLPNPLQRDIIANSLLCIFILIPFLLCLFPIYLLMVVAAVATGHGHKLLTVPLQKLEKLSISFANRTQQASEVAVKQSANVNAKFAGLERVVSHWVKKIEPKHPPTSENE